MSQEFEIEKVLWQQEIDALKRKVHGENLEKPIAFYGSSSIRLWDTLEVDLHPLPVINLGFGGSSYFWCNHFFEEIFEFVSPSQIVLYAGDNDLGTGVPELEILTNVKQLLEKIKLKYGAIPVGIISVKPSPDRKYLETAIKSLNRRLLDLTSNNECYSFIDIYPEMLDMKGQLRPELYIDDELHINAKGYEIWERVIKKHLQYG